MIDARSRLIDTTRRAWLMRAGASSLALASLGLLIIFVAMVLLSLARTRLKGRGAETWSFLRQRLGFAGS